MTSLASQTTTTKSNDGKHQVLMEATVDSISGFEDIRTSLCLANLNIHQPTTQHQTALN
jgi:hypothetical protein